MRFMLAMVIGLLLISFSFLSISILGMANNNALMGRWYWLYNSELFRLFMIVLTCIMLYLLIDRKQVQNGYVWVIEKMTCGRVKLPEAQ
jgi:hypothetical protein